MAWVALVAATLCWLVYILGCVLSSPAWSPDSTKVALLVTGPGEDPNQFKLFTYDRLTDQHRLLEEAKPGGFLSAPAWSPDGQWIAYYRIDPKLPADHKDPSDPNTPSSPNSAQAVKAPFTEENAFHPSFLFDIAAEHTEEPDPNETFEVKLMVVATSGKEKRVLRTMQWIDVDDSHLQLIFMSPTWSRDSQHLYYAQFIEEGLFYFAGLDIDTGQARAYVLSSLGTPSLSPDGMWVATLLETESEQLCLVLAKTNGSMQKSIALDSDIDLDDQLGLLNGISWSPDSTLVLVASEEVFQIVNTVTGHTRIYQDRNTDGIGYGVFSPEGDQLVYLANADSNDPNDPNDETQNLELRRARLDNGEIETLFKLSDMPDLEHMESGKFSISPNGKTVLLRGLFEDTAGEQKSILLFWDGKTHKRIETDPWLDESLESEAQVEEYVLP